MEPRNNNGNNIRSNIGNRIFRNLSLLSTLFLVLLLFQNCSGPTASLDESSPGNQGQSNSTTTTLPSNPQPSCDLAAKDLALKTKLQSIATDVSAYTLIIERNDGQKFVFNQGGSVPESIYESASTSKMVSAVILLRQIDKGFLSLGTRPQDLITDWAIPSGHALTPMTFRDLLSFTSGAYDEPLCINSPVSDFETCVKSIASKNLDKTKAPGSDFYYSSSHLQVAGLMAVKARGLTWTQIFNEFKAETGLFSNSSFDLPSESNPRLAGGMHWSTKDYHEFLKALSEGKLLSNASMTEFLKDQIATATVSNSPAKLGINEDWHYGLGHWFECHSLAWNCTASNSRLSSPGAYGAYPFWDPVKGYFGVLGRQGGMGTFREGYKFFDQAQSEVTAWVDCR